MATEKGTYYPYDASGLAGNIVRITNAQGVVTGSFEYNAWGEKLLDQPPPEGTRFGFSAPAWITLKDDPDGRFVITPTRTCDLATGRFLQRDPEKALAGSYVYVDQRPTALTDPTGRAAGNPCDNKDIDCVACMVFAESRGTPDACQQAIAAVINNRAKARKMSVCDVVSERNGAEFNGYKSANYSNCCKDCISDKDKKENDDAWRNTFAALHSAGEPAYTAGGATFFIDMSIPTPSWILDRIKEKKMKEVEVPGCNKFKFFKTE